MTIRYCTPEWLSESLRLYSPELEEALSKVTAKLFFRITAEPAWGIEEDILFGAVLEGGKMPDLAFCSEADAKATADFILSAPPQVWKGLLRRDKKFISEFMLGRVKLEQGSRTELLKITPYAHYVVDVLTQFELQYPDEMSAEELEAYRADLAAFRADTGV